MVLPVLDACRSRKDAALPASSSPAALSGLRRSWLSAVARTSGGESVIDAVGASPDRWPV